MNIPDEVIAVAHKRLWFDHISDEWGGTAPEIYVACETAARIVAPVIAEWARKEALREAEAVAREEAALRYDTPQIETAEYIADAIRALAEGGAA